MTIVYQHLTDCIYFKWSDYLLDYVNISLTMPFFEMIRSSVGLCQHLTNYAILWDDQIICCTMSTSHWLCHSLKWSDHRLEYVNIFSDYVISLAKIIIYWTMSISDWLYTYSRANYLIDNINISLTIQYLYLNLNKSSIGKVKHFIDYAIPLSTSHSNAIILADQIIF